MRCRYCGETIEDSYFWTNHGMCIYCYDLYKNDLKYEGEEDALPKKPMAIAGKREIEDQKKEIAN